MTQQASKMCFLLLHVVTLACHIFAWPAAAEMFSDSLTEHPGHLQKFGTGKQETQVIDEIDGFPSVQQFFENYALPTRPLIMRGAAKISPGYTRWTDEHFLSLQVPTDNTVLVETMKKEKSTQNTHFLNFKDFVRAYNASGQYMVNTVPEFLKTDVVLPGPLQCDQIYDNIIVDAIMWYSSGGTKSVVHTDSVENINCLYSGEKEFVMVNPHKYADQVDIDHPEGAYMGLDVDRVDFTKYPGLAEVEYQYVHLEPGDCLFIPYKWIHQVRSFHRNIAVNIWWNYHRNPEIKLEQCPTTFDPSLTLESVPLQGFDEVDGSVDEIRDHFMDIVQAYEVDIDTFINGIIPDREEIESMNPGVGYRLPIQAMFGLLDQNQDGLVNAQEVEQLPDEDWEKVHDQMRRLDAIMDALEQQWEEQMGKGAEPWDMGEEPEDKGAESRDEL